MHNPKKIGYRITVEKSLFEGEPYQVHQKVGDGAAKILDRTVTILDDFIEDEDEAKRTFNLYESSFYKYKDGDKQMCKTAIVNIYMVYKDFGNPSAELTYGFMRCHVQMSETNENI